MIWCNVPPAEWPGSFTCHCGITGVEGTPNKSQHRKLALEKKIPPPLLPGIKLATFRSRDRRTSNWAIPTPSSTGMCMGFNTSDYLSAAHGFTKSYVYYPLHPDKVCHVICFALLRSVTSSSSPLTIFLILSFSSRQGSSSYPIQPHWQGFVILSPLPWQRRSVTLFPSPWQSFTLKKFVNFMPSNVMRVSL